MLERAVPGGGRDLIGPLPAVRVPRLDGSRRRPRGARAAGGQRRAGRRPARRSRRRRAAPGRSPTWGPVQAPSGRDQEPVEPPAHHRRHIRRASEAVEVEMCAEPAGSSRTGPACTPGCRPPRLTGIRAFSRPRSAQLELPGLVAVRAERDGETVGMALWLEDAPRYYHLAAWSRAGYEVSASYALFAAAFGTWASSGVRWVELGRLAARSPGDGLSASSAGGPPRSDSASVRAGARPRQLRAARRAARLVPRVPRGRARLGGDERARDPRRRARLPRAAARGPPEHRRPRPPDRAHRRRARPRAG